MSAVAIELSRLRQAVAAEQFAPAGGAALLPAVVLPGAILLPTAVTAVVATVSEHFSQVSSDVEVVSVATTNSVYWILTFTVTVWCCAAAYTKPPPNAATSATSAGSCTHGPGPPSPRAGSSTAWVPRYPRSPSRR